FEDFGQTARLLSPRMLKHNVGDKRWFNTTKRLSQIDEVQRLDPGEEESNVRMWCSVVVLRTELALVVGDKRETNARRCLLTYTIAVHFDKNSICHRVFIAMERGLFINRALSGTEADRF